MTTSSIHTLTVTFAMFLALGVMPASAQKKKVAKAPAKTAKAQVITEVEDYSENPVCKVMVLDSTVVEKSKLLASLKLPATLGHIFVDDNTSENAYENAFGDQRIISKSDTKGHHELYRQTHLGNTWSEPELINIGGDFHQIYNPFMSPDGQTLYFAAASSHDESNKNLSLYMTTYDPATQSFLTPTQLPYPFTSQSDDIYYIEDDADSLAWFVSARRQMQGNVCIYTLRIHEPWVYYNAEEKTPAELKSLATIEKISDTWESQEAYNTEKARLDALRKTIETPSASERKVHFVCANDRLITKLSDFKSNESRNIYKQFASLEDDIQTQERQLEEFRRVYHNSMEESKDEMVQLITESEQKLASDRAKAKQLANDIRKIEN